MLMALRGNEGPQEVAAWGSHPKVRSRLTEKAPQEHEATGLAWKAWQAWAARPVLALKHSLTPIDTHCQQGEDDRATSQSQQLQSRSPPSQWNSPVINF